MQKQIRHFLLSFHFSKCRLAFPTFIDKHFNSAISILQIPFCKRSLAFHSCNFISATQISPFLLSFQFCIFISVRQILVSCSSIYFSFSSTSREKKISQKDFLSCLVGVELSQKNICIMPPLLHIANLLSSSMVVINKNPQVDIKTYFEEPLGEEKKKAFLWSKWMKTKMLGAIPFLQTHPLRMKLETCGKIAKVR